MYLKHHANLLTGFMLNFFVSSRFHWPDKGKPITFVDCLDGKEESTFDGNSMFNHAEATLVCVFVFNS